MSETEKSRSGKLTSFFELDLEYSSGIAPIEGADPHKVKVARWWNFIEPISTYAAVIATMWLTGLKNPIMYPIFGGLLIWLLVLSPMVHYWYEKDVFLEENQRNMGFYCMECRGFGSPVKYFKGDPEKGVPPLIKSQWKTIVTLLVLFGIMFVLAIMEFWNNSIFENLLTKTLHMTANDGNKALIAAALIAILLVVLFFGFSIVIRFDTLKKGAKHLILMFALGIPLVLVFTGIFILIPALPYFPYALPSDYMTGTIDKTILVFSWPFGFFQFMGQWTGYVWWGYAQQLLFLSIFSTMFTRAFDVRTRRGQWLACIASGGMFGFMHLPTFWLSFFTWVAGVMWAWFFMRNRNLFVMGVCHGAMGSLLNELTPIKFSVGPTSI
ncbi:MAG TPA: CPBP family intramembrane glutamic endopeptidase [Candidatus Lokiarchaeia archaeon]|nr:CPBP family intramembrane glutamic endopeptidase [Candidatus Lokiarchaeia archaeon]